MFGDASWEAMAAQQEESRRVAMEQDRRTAAQLLLARGLQAEAAVVAASELTIECVDNWDGGQYEATLAVPPEAYDAVREFMHVALASAVAAVVGESRFQQLHVILRRAEYVAGWDADFIAALVRERRTSWHGSRRVVAGELSGPEDEGGTADSR